MDGDFFYLIRQRTGALSKLFGLETRDVKIKSINRGPYSNKQYFQLTDKYLNSFSIKSRLSNTLKYIMKLRFKKGIEYFYSATYFEFLH